MRRQAQTSGDRDVGNPGETVHQWALGDGAGQTGLGGRQLDDVHAGKRGPPHEHSRSVELFLGSRPRQGAAVILELAPDGKELSWPAGGFTPVSVIEYDGCESFGGKSLRERCQSAGLDASDAVCHHHDWNRARSTGPVHPGIKLLVRAGRDAHLAADYGIVCHHDVTVPGAMICAPASRAKSAPNSVPGVKAPGRPSPSINRATVRAATLAVKA